MPEFNLTLIFEIALALVIMGVIEGVVKPIASYQTRRQIVKWAPSVLSTLDPMMPSLIQEKSGKELDTLVRDKFTNLTGEDWHDIDVKYFWQLYDPRVSADKIEQKG
jgi:hypothetical protein